MRILLTGGLGFIGKNFLLHRPKNWEAVSLDLIEDKKFQKKVKNTNFIKINLTDENQVIKLTKKIQQKFDICLHLAANGDPALSVPDPAWDLDATAKTLINICQHFKIKKLIYFSSGAVYNGLEGKISPDKMVDPILPYAISHLAAEQYAKFYQNIGKIKEYVIIRFFGAYGPYEPDRKIYTNLVKKIAINREKEFIVRGNGQNRIDAMYVSDAVAGVVKVIKSRKVNLICDFCQGEHSTVNQLVKEAARIFQSKITVKHEGKVPEYNQFYASNKEFEKLFGFKAIISLEEGLKKLEGHMRSNKE